MGEDHWVGANLLGPQNLQGYHPSNWVVQEDLEDHQGDHLEDLEDLVDLQGDLLVDHLADHLEDHLVALGLLGGLLGVVHPAGVDLEPQLELLGLQGRIGHFQVDL